MSLQLPQIEGRRRTHASCAGLVAALIMVLALRSSRIFACGPFFPNQVLVTGDKGLLDMPSGDFESELDKCCRDLKFPVTKPYQFSPPDYVETHDDTVVADGADLRASVATTGLPAATSADLIKRYTELRTQLDTAHDSNNHSAANLQIPDGLPTEFQDYIAGAIAFHHGDIASARSCWRKLLDLPAEQRHYRSTWATFMLGKSYLTENPDQAKSWFARTRDLAAHGCVDSLELAPSSLGWEGQIELSAKHFNRAMLLYLLQHAGGDSTARMSLRETISDLFKAGSEAVDAAAKDDVCRRVITADLLSEEEPASSSADAESKMVPTWLQALDSANISDVQGADRLAWAAYRCGDFDAAAKWVAKAGRHQPVAQWVRAKLLLRNGDISGAAAILSKLVQSFPPDNQWLTDVGVNGEETSPGVPDSGSATGIIPAVTGDLAVLSLARSQYTDAMNLLLRSDYWIDAAFVGERVLSVDELKADVDRFYPEASQVSSADFEVWTINSRKNQATEGMRIRYLLARRLARLGRWKQAMNYFPVDLQPKFAEYISAIRSGADNTRSDTDRAASYMNAARIAHGQGMELLGTELDPDYHCFDGNFNYDPFSSDWLQAQTQTITGPSADELARYRANAPVNSHRFHYRYVAADHAWAAAQLMPDNTEQTAAVLYEAGCWLKDQDADSADRFYKDLVRRCPDTPLGKQALAIHWFPKAGGTPSASAASSN
jgi:tetratricopeptide (TPR) repeat protein